MKKLLLPMLLLMLPLYSSSKIQAGVLYTDAIGDNTHALNPDLASIELWYDATHLNVHLAFNNALNVDISSPDRFRGVVVFDVDHNPSTGFDSGSAGFAPGIGYDFSFGPWIYDPITMLAPAKNFATGEFSWNLISFGPENKDIFYSMPIAFFGTQGAAVASGFGSDSFGWPDDIADRVFILPSAVAEPSSALLVVPGILAFLALRYRRKA